MRDGLRYSLLLIAGLIAVLLIVSFTAWGLTTYGSIRHIVGDMAARPDKAAALQGQYGDMVAYFAAGDGSSFTYHFGSAPITVTMTQVTNLSEDQVIGLVLDGYASGLYDNDLPSGGIGAAGFFIGSGGNPVYALVTILLFAVFALALASAVLGFPESPRPFKLKSAGKAMAVAGTATFFVFAFLPGLIRSLYWGSIANDPSIKDLLVMIAPMIATSLLRNTLLLLVLAAALYAAGWWLHVKGEAEASWVGAAAPQKVRNGQQNKKRRSL